MVISRITRLFHGKSSITAVVAKCRPKATANRTNAAISHDGASAASSPYVTRTSIKFDERSAAIIRRLTVREMVYYARTGVLVEFPLLHSVSLEFGEGGRVVAE